MRRSREVPVTLLASIALSTLSAVAGTGCNDQPETRNCVDAQNHVLPDNQCRAGGGGAHYIYGGHSGGSVGDTVVGGSESSGVARGGFGHGEGGGEGGGE